MHVAKNCFCFFVFSICDSYLPDLVLQGVPDNDFRESLTADLKLALQVRLIEFVNPFNPFTPEPPVTACVDPRPFYRLSCHQF